MTEGIVELMLSAHRSATSSPLVHSPRQAATILPLGAGLMCYLCARFVPDGWPNIGFQPRRPAPMLPRLKPPESASKDDVAPRILENPA